MPRRILVRVKQKPKAVFWYKVYCYCFSALNFYSAWHGWQLVRNPYGIIRDFKFLQDLAVDEASTEATVFMVQGVGWSLFAMGLIFGITAFSLPQAPDNRKTWVAHMVHILFGATSCVLTPLCLPLLIAWFKPEVKEYFGVPVREE